MHPGYEPPLHVEPEAAGWRSPLIIAILVGLGVLLAILWLGRPESQPREPVPATLPPVAGAARDYAAQISFGRMELSRWRNFLGQEVIYLDFTVTNNGTHTIRALEVTIKFQDQLDRVVLRETVRPAGKPAPFPGQASGPLGPGQTRNVRVGFEHIPADWNGRAPAIDVTGLLLETPPAG